MENVITRKIQLIINGDKDYVKDVYKTLYSWQNIVHKAANFVSTHLFFQEQAKELIYFTDEVKMKLSSISKDENGMLITSKQNSTYRILSEKYKGEIPTAILTGLNSVITSTFNKERKDYYIGKRSLRSYRSNIPIPVSANDFLNFIEIEHGNYSFNLYKLKFKTFFGKDLSRNKVIFSRALSGEYKFCDSSIKIEDNKIYLLLTVRFKKIKVAIDAEKTADCYLSVEYPITIKEKKDFWKIGTKEDYLHKRVAIQGALHRLQKASRENKGGKGRSKKLMSIERFKLTESNYINTKMHQYSSKLIDYCLKRGIGTIVLNNIKQTEEEVKENPFLFRNWSYGNLKDKIEYKAKKYGIFVQEK
jgi:IS605 OrfB family transposase